MLQKVEFLPSLSKKQNARNNIYKKEPSNISAKDTFCPVVHMIPLPLGYCQWFVRKRRIYTIYNVRQPMGQFDMLDERQRMEDQYLSSHDSQLRRFLKRVLSLGGDYRHPASRAAFNTAIVAQCKKGISISIGGGPFRAHPKLLNLNIGAFPNVDIVGNAYHLPFGAQSVNAIHCEAVLEHLEFPNRAVEEMFRVLDKKGQVVAVTPFLQAFHGYPNHFQNYTLEGHRRLFERAGFELVDSGTCVGPIYSITDLLSSFFVALFPGLLGQVLS